MLGKGVIIGGLLLATGIAGAQVLQNKAIPRGDADTPVVLKSRSGALSLRDLAGPSLHQSSAPQEGVPGGGCQAFFTKTSFDAFNQADGKTLKGIEDFEESDVLDGQKFAIPAPLQGGVPSPGFPNGLTQNNLIIQDNITPGASPPQLNPSGDPQALYAIGQGFAGANSKKAGEDIEVLTGQEASLDLIFLGDNKTGVGFTLSHFDQFPGGSWVVAVYDISNNLIGKFDVPDAIEPSKQFFGVWCAAGIGRINIWDVEIGPDAIDNIQMYVEQEPSCQWDCAFPQDKNVGINDFLALLAGWGLPGPCDFDGGGVGINDFLKLLAHWGPCPFPINDECAGKIYIDRFDSNGVHTEHFDMYGATPSAEASQCLPAGFQAKDIWYCLQNNSNEAKIVTLTCDVDLFVEVTAGCDCANPGPLVTCGVLIGAGTQFNMQAGEQVCIRLYNDLNLPNDVIKGNLIITNTPADIPTEKCFDQQPNQVNGIFSDLDCDACVAGGNPQQQLLAEQLVLVTPESIHELRFWGGYFPGDAGGGVPLPDNFTVKFRLNDNSAGVDQPGSVVRKIQIGPATTRTETGVILFGVREFEYSIVLDPNQDHLPGLYWVEIYNDTSNDPTNDDWFWETGTLDVVNGLPGSAFSFDPPNVVPKAWSFDTVNDLSLNIECKTDGPGTVRFDEDPASFFNNLPLTKFTKFQWGFKPDHLQQGMVVPIQDPLDINTHPNNAPGVWIGPLGNLWPPEVDNVQFASNLNPQGPYAPGDGLLYHKGPTLQFPLDNNGLVAAPAPVDTSFEIFSGPPAGDNHTAFELELVSATPGAVAVMHISVYDKQDNEIGKHIITMLPTEKRYLGIVATVTIGRIDIWDTNGGDEGISAITAWQDGGSVKTIFPGDDCWATPCGNTQATLNLPPDFFGPGCDPFVGIVQLGGQTGFIDTVVARLAPMVFDDNNLPQTQTIPIELIQLDLVSCSPITVNCPGGPQLWQVEVHVENPQPQGQMTATKVTPTNGVYDATLPVDPRFTFIEVGGPGLIPSVDLGGFVLDTLDAPFKQGPVPFACSPDFAPGWGKGPNGEPCCQETCHDNPGGDHLHCAVPPKCQPQCPPSP